MSIPLPTIPGETAKAYKARLTAWKQVKLWPANRLERLHRYDDRELLRWEAFSGATAGRKVWNIAKAFNTLRPGVDFRGMSKLALADEFVRGDLREVTSAQLRSTMVLLP